MITASRLAGFCAAHAVWSLSTADFFVPMSVYTTAEGQRQLERLVGEDTKEVLELAKNRLELNEVDANDAVLLYNGYIKQGDKKMHAIIIEMRAYFMPDSEAVIAVPYTPKSSGKFLIHKPTRPVWKNCEDIDDEWALDSFFEGVNEHKQGSIIWREALA